MQVIAVPGHGEEVVGQPVHVGRDVLQAVTLVSELIKQATVNRKMRFDFLKGDEVYKYRLGATARPLWRIKATVRGQS